MQVPLAHAVAPLYPLPPHWPYSATVPVPALELATALTAAATEAEDLTTVWRVVLALQADFEDAGADDTTAMTLEVVLALQADLVDEATTAAGVDDTLAAGVGEMITAGADEEEVARVWGECVSCCLVWGDRRGKERERTA